mmetsp:Transcript_3723/g.11791  ORF Transcript_3723/g.11791 Transcript_3723/m.11791 type:complete len:231 (+) Transcript_3723:42-734(+)
MSLGSIVPTYRHGSASPQYAAGRIHGYTRSWNSCGLQMESCVGGNSWSTYCIPLWKQTRPPSSLLSFAGSKPLLLNKASTFSSSPLTAFSAFARCFSCHAASGLPNMKARLTAFHLPVVMTRPSSGYSTTASLSGCSTSTPLGPGVMSGCRKSTVTLNILSEVALYRHMSCAPARGLRSPAGAMTWNRPGFNSETSAPGSSSYGFASDSTLSGIAEEALIALCGIRVKLQ